MWLAFKLDLKRNKAFRLINIYERLNKGEFIQKRNLAEAFGVTEKTVQRDIDDLRIYLAETHLEEKEVHIKYDRTKNVYYLVRFEREWLTNEEVMALCKILLESRAFCKDELNGLISKLLIQAIPSERKKIESMIRNEQQYYIPLKHNKRLLKQLWELSQYILSNEIINFAYTRQDGQSNNREVKPVAIMFSEYYFYLVAFMADDSKDFPTIFRVDRIKNLKGSNQKFKIPYNERFSEGEFRKRIQFMYSGELKKIKFEFSGSSLEAILDRLPTAEIIAENNGVYTIRAEAYGDGVEMWLRSQGDWVRMF